MRPRGIFEAHTRVTNDLLEPATQAQSEALMGHHCIEKDLHAQSLLGNVLRVGLQERPELGTHTETQTGRKKKATECLNNRIGTYLDEVVHFLAGDKGSFLHDPPALLHAERDVSDSKCVFCLGFFF